MVELPESGQNKIRIRHSMKHGTLSTHYSDVSQLTSAEILTTKNSILIEINGNVESRFPERYDAFLHSVYDAREQKRPAM